MYVLNREGRELGESFPDLGQNTRNDTQIFSDTGMVRCRAIEPNETTQTDRVAIWG